jgi:hypothetical protein
MKKTPFIVVLLGIGAFSLTQNCAGDRSKPETGKLKEAVDTIKKPNKNIYEHKETVEIYLCSIRQIGERGDTSYHLAMFDANGDYAVDTLTTMFLPEKSKPGHIKWKEVYNSGIGKIINIEYAGVGEPIIFKNGVSHQTGDGWNLDLREDLYKYVGEKVLKEKYIIKYIPVNYNDTVIIDPYLRVLP